MIEPRVLWAAQQIYYNYANIHPVRAQYVTGVAIDRETCKGFVSFRQQAIVLPREVFIRTDALFSHQQMSPSQQMSPGFNL
nr:hypothetical protein [[Leptolyngbya] sp. PCC 7376]